MCLLQHDATLFALPPCFKNSQFFYTVKKKIPFGASSRPPLSSSESSLLAAMGRNRVRQARVRVKPIINKKRKKKKKKKKLKAARCELSSRVCLSVRVQGVGYDAKRSARIINSRPLHRQPKQLKGRRKKKNDQGRAQREMMKK